MDETGLRCFDDSFWLFRSRFFGKILYVLDRLFSETRVGWVEEKFLVESVAGGILRFFPPKVSLL
jgi:hypothetical protein